MFRDVIMRQAQATGDLAYSQWLFEQQRNDAHPCILAERLECVHTVVLFEQPESGWLMQTVATDLRAAHGRTESTMRDSGLYSVARARTHSGRIERLQKTDEMRRRVVDFRLLHSIYG